MRIHVYPIISQLHGSGVLKESEEMIHLIQQEKAFDIHITSLDELYHSDLAFILVQSGGSEAEFLRILPKLQTPIYLLTYGGNNSLAASMEILSYLNLKHLPGEILHGSISGIIKRIFELTSQRLILPIRLGIVGKPSDWLIASEVDKIQCRNTLGIELVDIEMKELIQLFPQSNPNEFVSEVNLNFERFELEQSKRVSLALDALIKKYQLSGLTIRCFDLLDSIHTTGCLALSLLNMNGIIGTCEGDVPSMISMYLLKKITNQSGFQANPSSIDTENSTVLFAHCTIPFDMVDDYTLTTHFESGIGVAIKGQLRKEDITIFKLSSDLQHYYVEEGRIIDIPNHSNLCRTQVVVSLPDTSYFLKAPYGNHHIIIYGHHLSAIKKAMNSYL